MALFIIPGAALAEMGIKAGISGIQAWSNRLWQKRQWEKMLAYNTPGRQMDRFRKAGLNPNLIYSQGSPGNAPGFPTGGQASPPNTDIPGALLKDSQSKLASSQTGLIPIQKDLIVEQILTEKSKQAQNYANQMQSMSQAGLNTAKETETYVMLGAKRRQIEQEILRGEADVDLKYSTIQLNSAKKLLTDAQLTNTDLDSAFKMVKAQYASQYPDRVFDTRNLFRGTANLLENTGLNFIYSDRDSRFAKFLRENMPNLWIKWSGERPIIGKGGVIEWLPAESKNLSK
jgi:hypothetical protein